MNVIFFTTAFILCNSAFAQNFKVKNPIVQNFRVSVPLKDITCNKGPFFSGQIQLILPSPQIGSPEQKGILKSDFMNSISECTDILTALKSSATSNANIDIEFKVIQRAILKISSDPNSSNCEGAIQELVTTTLGNVPVLESIQQVKVVLDCPASKQHIQMIRHSLYYMKMEFQQLQASRLKNSSPQKKTEMVYM
jgi:hypothetical protein